MISKKIFFLLSFLILFNNISNADVPYFLDFKYILNTSDAGKKAQDFLQESKALAIKKKVF